MNVLCIYIRYDHSILRMSSRVISGAIWECAVWEESIYVYVM